MKIANGQIILEVVPCFYCHGTRKVNEWVKCSICNGTGKKANSNRRCPTCGDNFHNSLIRGKVLSIGTGICESCVDGTEVETLYDHATSEIWKSLNFKVYRSDRHQTINEYLLGNGCVYSCTDYGAYQKLTDGELIEKVKESSSHQAISFSTKEGLVCDHIGIFCNNQGYSVKAVFTVSPKEIEKEFKKGLCVETGMMVGGELAKQGLNGTAIVTEFKG